MLAILISWVAALPITVFYHKMYTGMKRTCSQPSANFSEISYVVTLVFLSDTFQIIKG